MPSLRAVQLPAIEEEPDTSVEAVVVAAIRLHECIEASLRRFAAEDVACTPREWLLGNGRYGMLDASDPKLQLAELLTKYEAAGVPSPAYTDQAREEAIVEAFDQGGRGGRSSRLKNRGERRCGFSGKPSSGAASTTFGNRSIVEERPR